MKSCPSAPRSRPSVSPSARKVWIEISHTACAAGSANASPSARKVWIEIGFAYHQNTGALRHLPRGRCGLKYLGNGALRIKLGHLPRGRCGLKCCVDDAEHILIGHLPRGRCGLKFLESPFVPAPHVTFRKEGVD